MSAVFTQHAVERMRERGLTQAEVMRLLEVVARVADDPGERSRSHNVLRVGRQRGEDAFIVRAGDMRAVMTVDPAKPEQFVVMNVYRADEGDAADGGGSREEAIGVAKAG